MSEANGKKQHLDLGRPGWLDVAILCRFVGQAEAKMRLLIGMATLVAGVGAMLVLGADVRAQETNSLKEGAMALSFGVPSGGNPLGDALIGFKKHLSAERAVSLDVGYSATFPDEGDATAGFVVAPSYYYYFMTAERVVVFARVLAALEKAEGIDFDAGLEVFGGLFAGAEFFVTKEFSLAGQLGAMIEVVDDFNTVRTSSGTGALSVLYYW